MAGSRFVMARAAAALFLSVLFPVAPAIAQQPPAASAEAPTDARVAEAKARYEAGARAYAEHRYKDAVDLFLEADRIVSSAPLSFNIARAYEKLGDSSGALSWYRDYLRRDPTAKNAAEVRGFIATLEDKLAEKGVQQLSVRSTPKGATVTIDGEPVGVTPWTGDLAPGAHRVTLELKGYDASTRDIELESNDALDVEIPLTVAVEEERAASPALAPSMAQPKEREPGHSFGVWPYVALGAGAVGLGGALYFEISRQSAEDDARGEPTQIGYRDAYETMQSRQTTARVLAGVGGALVLAGGTLLVIELASRPEDEAHAKAALACGAFGCGLSAQGRF
jgi:tetratricopeptide (TPR) repeat protein